MNFHNTSLPVLNRGRNDYLPPIVVPVLVIRDQANYNAVGTPVPKWTFQVIYGTICPAVITKKLKTRKLCLPQKEENYVSDQL